MMHICPSSPLETYLCITAPKYDAKKKKRWNSLKYFYVDYKQLVTLPVKGNCPTFVYGCHSAPVVIWETYFRINAIAAVRGRRQRLRRGTPHRTSRCGRGCRRGCTAAQNQVVPPQADIGVAAGGGVDFLGIDGATGKREKNNI